MFSERGKVNLSSGAPAMVITKLVTVGRSLDRTVKSGIIICQIVKVQQKSRRNIEPSNKKNVTSQE